MLVSIAAERAVERAEQLRQPPLRDALVVVGVPAVERECADARSVRLSEEFRRRAGRIGEIAAHLRGARSAARLLCLVAGMLDGGELDALVDRASRA